MLESPPCTDPKSPTIGSGPCRQNGSESCTFTEPLWGLQKPFSDGVPFEVCHGPGKKPGHCTQFPISGAETKAGGVLSCPRSQSWDVQGRPWAMTDSHQQLRAGDGGAFLSHVRPLSAWFPVVCRPGTFRSVGCPRETRDHGDHLGNLTPKTNLNREGPSISKHSTSFKKQSWVPYHEPGINAEG